MKSVDCKNCKTIADAIFYRDQGKRMKEALENIASLDRVFVEYNGEEGAFCRIISEARKGLGETVDVDWKER